MPEISPVHGSSVLEEARPLSGWETLGMGGGRSPATLAGPPRGGVSWRQRSLAILSILSAAGLIAVAVVFIVNHGRHIVIGLVGLAIAAVGGWWLITGHTLKRTVGAIGAILGLGILVWVVIEAGAESDYPGLKLALVVLLLTLTFGCARITLVHGRKELERRQSAHRRSPAHPVLICNPWSGGGKVEKFGLVELANELGIETIMLDHGLDLEQLARDAIARGADCLGMAGGDGSQSLVASIAVEHDVPFVCVTAGTRNHFGLDLGLDRDDPRKSLFAFRDAIERRVDYATVNGRFFVNNVSLGIYATIVQQAGYREAKVETSTTQLPELLGRRDQPFDLQFTDPDGTEVEGPYLIQVSNNPYILGATMDVSQRRRMDTGELGVFAVTGASGLEAAEIVTLTTVGQRRLSKNWHEFTTKAFEVRSRSGKAPAGVDGEALELDTPMEFAIHPGGLRLLVPEGNLILADRRRARQVAVRDLFKVVAGIDPVQDLDPAVHGDAAA